jgi:hypothetical protein
MRRFHDSRMDYKYFSPIGYSLITSSISFSLSPSEGRIVRFHTLNCPVLKQTSSFREVVGYKVAAWASKSSWGRTNPSLHQ